MSTSNIAGGTDRLRQSNLSALLRIVAAAGPLTRADLARRTGLNRSTVGTLVNELVEFGFVAEAQPETTAGVGRPSSVVSVNEAVTAITVQPRADAIGITQVGLGGVVQREIWAEEERAPTVREAVNVSAAVIEAMRSDPVNGGRMLGACVVVPGPVSQESGQVSVEGTLLWDDVPFGRMLAEATGLAVRVATDAHVAVLAESRFGAGRGARDLLYVTGDALGIRGGIVVQGEALTGSRGSAGDIGHLQVDPSGAPCSCGRSGCLQQEVSVARLLAASNTTGGRDLEQLLTSPTKRLAGECERQLDLLGQALLNAIRLLDPELVVLDGYLRVLLDRFPARLIDRFVAAGSAVKVVGAELPGDNVTLGASQLVFGELLENPSLVAERFSQPADDSQHWSRQRLNPALFPRAAVNTSTDPDRSDEH